MDWPKSFRGLVDDAKSHPALVFLAFTLVLLSLIIGALVWFGHIEREKRQTWIETKLEDIETRCNTTLARVDAALTTQGSTNEDVKQELEATRFELRETRKACLVVRDLLMQKADAP